VLPDIDFWRSAVPFVDSVFRRLLEPLDRRVVNRIVTAHDGNRHVGEGAGAWTCQRHLKALLFAQLAGLDSLREIEEALAGHPAALYHLALRPPRRSTLSDASAKRPAAVFADLCQHVMAQASPGLRGEGQALIRLIDATGIALRDRRFAFAEADARLRGLKLHLVFDPGAELPVHFAITSPKVSDIAAGRTIAIEPGVTYVFDKGYTDYAWWQDIVAAEAVFVTRLKANAHRRQIAERVPQGEAILADRSLRIGHRQPRGGASNPLYDTNLREVVIARPDKAPLHLVTNDHRRSAEEIAALYKQRWEIELFFKWIKQNLKIKSFLGRSGNAVRIQILVALIAFVLLHLYRTTVARNYPTKGSAFLARLRVGLFDRLDLTGKARPPPRSPACLPPNPQLTLQLQ
jgi:hypothetical protein